MSKSLERRIENIEARRLPEPEKPVMKTATFNRDGTITVRLPDVEFQLPDEQALENWIEEKNINEAMLLKVHFPERQDYQKPVC